MEALRNRWVRCLGYFVLGAVVATLLARLFHPHYLGLCNNVKVDTGDECSPMPLQAMVGVFLVGMGLVSMLVVPIVTSLYNVVRRGYDWETSRVETAVSNLPILAGLVYFAAGVAIALAEYN